jgi:Domain of unknown function (DUF929)
MLGSGPDDAGDILEAGPQKPPRNWAIGPRGRRALATAAVFALVAAGGTVAGLRLFARGPADPALARLVTEVTTVPVNEAGSGFHFYVGSLPVATSSGNSSSSAYSSSIAISLGAGEPSPAGPNALPLFSGGKPEVLFVGTEYCPYCIARSWPLIVALSRFGQFSGLSTIRSAHFDGIAPVDGWTFYGSTYTSPYLAFAPVETHSNVLVSPKADQGNPKSYRALQPLTPVEQAVVSQYDSARQTPFVDFGGTATALGSDVDPSSLAGLSWNQIAADLRRPDSTAGAAILFSADVLTSEFCQLTGGRPATVCPLSSR